MMNLEEIKNVKEINVIGKHGRLEEVKLIELKDGSQIVEIGGEFTAKGVCIFFKNVNSFKKVNDVIDTRECQDYSKLEILYKKQVLEYNKELALKIFN